MLTRGCRGTVRNPIFSPLLVSNAAFLVCLRRSVIFHLELNLFFTHDGCKSAQAKMCKQANRSLRVLITSELGWNRQEREALRRVQSQKAPPPKIFTSHLDNGSCFPPGSRYHVLVHATNALSSPNQCSQLHPAVALHQRKTSQ